MNGKRFDKCVESTRIELLWKLSMFSKFFSAQNFYTKVHCKFLKFNKIYELISFLASRRTTISKVSPWWLVGHSLDSAPTPAMPAKPSSLLTPPCNSLPTYRCLMIPNRLVSAVMTAFSLSYDCTWFWRQTNSRFGVSTYF